jgi:hypothetical protein
LAKALDVEVRELFEEPVPLGEAPREAGLSLLDKGLDAARQDEETAQKAINRLKASQGVLPSTIMAEFEEDQFRAELRARGFPDEYFEGFIWPLVVKAARADQLEQELAQVQVKHAEKVREETQRA